jgi:hypothetical protein
MHPRRIALAALVAAALVTGCVSQDRPETCDADEAAIEVTVTATGMEPNDPAACRGQDLVITVHPEVDGVLHIHGLDAVVPATTITDGDDITLAFEADRSGQFPIELHLPGTAQGVSVGVLTLHER